MQTGSDELDPNVVALKQSVYEMAKMLLPAVDE